jgi:hypothetical protein
VTTYVTRSGTREMSFQLAEPPLVANLERFLLDYFERQLTSGTSFLPGQIIQLGWTLLRVTERADGTLGVQQRERVPEMPWLDTIDRALSDLWLQREVCASVGLDPEFPREDETALVTACADDAASLRMSRLIRKNPDLAGWAVTCADTHDHGPGELVPLIAIAANLPAVVQLLALPYGLTVEVDYRPIGDGRSRIAPRVLRGASELEPRAGSYLAALRG